MAWAGGLIGGWGLGTAATACGVADTGEPLLIGVVVAVLVGVIGIILLLSFESPRLVEVCSIGCVNDLFASFAEKPFAVEISDFAGFQESETP